MSLFLSTLSLRRATILVFCGPQGSGNFYPRSPCGERRQWRRSVKLFRQFLSTLSLRRATPNRRPCPRSKKFLSTLSLRRATDEIPNQCKIDKHFYPRSPCGERLISQSNGSTTIPFLSTLSLRRATLGGMSDKLIGSVFLSTLSLRRATPVCYAGDCTATHFYPRSPCGERQ